MSEYDLDLDTFLSGFGTEDILSTITVRRKQTPYGNANCSSFVQSTPSPTTSSSETDSGVGATPPMDPFFDDVTIDVNNLGNKSTAKMSLPFFTFIYVDFPLPDFDVDFEKFLAQNPQVSRQKTFFSIEFSLFCRFCHQKAARRLTKLTCRNRPNSSFRKFRRRMLRPFLRPTRILKSFRLCPPLRHQLKSNR